VGISTHWLNGLTDNRSILMERPVLRGFLPALSYPPCHAFVTPTMHNAVSQKDLAPSTGSPAKCRFFRSSDMLFTKCSQNGAQIERTKGFDPIQRPRHLQAFCCQPFPLLSSPLPRMESKRCPPLNTLSPMLLNACITTNSPWRLR